LSLSLPSALDRHHSANAERVHGLDRPLDRCEKELLFSEPAATKGR